MSHSDDHSCPKLGSGGPPEGTHPVEKHRDQAACVRCHRKPQRRPPHAGDSQDCQGELRNHAEHDILNDNHPAILTVRDCTRDKTEVVRRLDDVGALGGQGRPAEADGPAHVRSSQGGGVVDAITHHHHRLLRLTLAAPQALKQTELALRQQPPVPVLDAQHHPDIIHNLLTVAAEDGHLNGEFAPPAALHPLHRVKRRGVAGGVVQGVTTSGPAVCRGEHHGLSRAQLRKLTQRKLSAWLALRHTLGVPLLISSNTDVHGTAHAYHPKSIDFGARPHPALGLDLAPNQSPELLHPLPFNCLGDAAHLVLYDGDREGVGRGRLQG
eukprot:Hpha_TRINITY_DN16378_c0_g2::TRINITY_DN16378_c0_g2_i2::g.61354::m.61354